MASVLGVGGIFFKSPDPQKLFERYSRWLGLDVASDAGTTHVVFRPGTLPKTGYTVWSAFDSATTYFAPSDQPFMFNLIVDNLEEALRQVSAGGAQLVGEIEQSEYGRFGWFLDPDGNKVELWEPPSP